MTNTNRYALVLIPDGVVYATVRGDDNEVDGDSDVECRFTDGQKYAAVQTSGHMHGHLADMVAATLSPKSDNPGNALLSHIKQLRDACKNTSQDPAVLKLLNALEELGPMSEELIEGPTRPIVERTNCEVLVAPATVFGVGVPLSMIMDNIRSRSGVEGGPFRIPDAKLAPQYISAGLVDEAIQHALKTYPHAEDALTCLAAALMPQVALSPTDLEWARQEIETGQKPA